MRQHIQNQDHEVLGAFSTRQSGDGWVVAGPQGQDIVWTMHRWWAEFVVALLAKACEEGPAAL